MYPVRLGYDKAIQRIGELRKNGHHSEALVSSVFTVEKTFRRTLRQLIVSCGFASKYADKIINGIRGLEALKNAWLLYDPDHTPLTQIVQSSDWQTFKSAAEKRNKMVHGERVYELKTCRKETTAVLNALDRLKKNFDRRYGYSGWTRLAARSKSKLHVDRPPKGGDS